MQLTIYLYFSLFVLLFFILFIVRADIIIECLINDKNNNAVFELRLLKGFIKFKIKLPAHTLKKIIGALGKDIDLKKSRFSVLTVYLVMIRFLKINLWLLKYAHVKKFSWKTTLGLSNPAVTAVFSSFFSIAVDMFVRVLLKKSKGTITTPEVMVLPNFWNDCLHTHLYCILTIPMGYIITAAVKMAFLVICFFVHKKIGGVDLRGQSSH